MPVRSLLILFFIILIQNVFASTLPGFNQSARALCRLELSRLQVGSKLPLVESFVARRIVAEQRGSSTRGQIHRDVLKFLGLDTDNSGKNFVMENLWWKEGQRKIDANDKALGKEGSRYMPKDGVLVSSYTGEMLFLGDNAQARIVLTVTDSQKAVSPMDLAKFPKLKPTAEVEVTITDSGKNMNEATFRGWVHALIKESGLAHDISNQSSLQIRAQSKSDGSIEYSFRLPRRTLPYREVTWLVENVQRSLAADDYWLTRREAESRVGIQSHNQLSGSMGSPFSGAGRSMRMADPSAREEMDEFSGAAQKPAKTKKDKGPKNPTPYKRVPVQEWNSEDQEY